MKETFKETVARSIQPYEGINGKPQYNMLLSEMLWEMATLVANIRTSFIAGNDLPRMTTESGQVLQERSAPHKATTEELLYFDDKYSWGSIGLRAQFGCFIKWLMDQEIRDDTELRFTDWRDYASKWNEYLMQEED